jgi:hypothetical protein
MLLLLMTAIETLSMTNSNLSNTEETGTAGESTYPMGPSLSVPQAREFLQIKDGAILHNYSPNTKLTDALKQSRLNPLTSVQKQLILGTLLGDGSMVFMANHPRYRASQGIKQKEYTLHKARILENYINTPPAICPNLGYGSQLVVFSTVTTPVLDFIPVLCYRNIEGKYVKHVNLSWLNELTWEGIAYWFMDDGALQSSANIVMNTQGFSESEVKMLADWLTSMGTRAKATKASNYWVVRLNKANSLKFIENVRPYIIPELMYKCQITTTQCPCGKILVKTDAKHCKECRMAYVAQYKREWHQANKSKEEYKQQRAINDKAFKVRRKADPEMYAKLQEYWKEQGKKRRQDPVWREKKNARERLRRSKKKQVSSQ